MKTGWKLLMHALRMLFANLPAAIRVSWLPFLLMVVANWYYLRYMRGVMVMMPHGPSIEPARLGEYGLVVLGYTILTGVLFAWIAVGWHRYILLEEEPGAVAAPPMSRVLAYFGRSILLALIVVIPTALVGVVLGAMIGVIAAAGQVSSPGAATAFGVFVGLVIWFVALFFFYRFGIVLPATAIGRPLGFGEAWRATRGTLGAILLLTLIMTLVGILSNILLTGRVGFATLPPRRTRRWPSRSSSSGHGS